jgi:sugar lactone lactonase YvrE
MSTPTMHSVDLVLEAGCRLGEGPVWDERDARLMFVDILAGTVHRYDPADQRHEVVDVGPPVGAAVPRAGGGVALAVRAGFALLDGASADVVPIADVRLGVGEQRMNDGKVDPAGRFWAGTHSADGVEGAAALYRLELDRSVTTVLDGVTISNGLDWSPDHRTMYYIDTPSGGVDSFAFDLGSGAIECRRRLVDIVGGLPDGMTVDADGCLWVAVFGGGAVHRYAPDGRLDCVVRLPVSLATSCAFGGSGLDILFITTASHRLSSPEPSAGALFACRPGVQGLASHRYAG